MLQILIILNSFAEGYQELNTSIFHFLHNNWKLKLHAVAAPGFGRGGGVQPEGKTLMGGRGNGDKWNKGGFPTGPKDPNQAGGGGGGGRGDLLPPSPPQSLALSLVAWLFNFHIPMLTKLGWYKAGQHCSSATCKICCTSLRIPLKK